MGGFQKHSTCHYCVLDWIREIASLAEGFEIMHKSCDSLHLHASLYGGVHKHMNATCVNPKKVFSKEVIYVQIHSQTKEESVNKALRLPTRAKKGQTTM